MSDPDPTKDVRGGEAAVQPELTVMFYMASDNPLAPNVVSQLKAIKNAGQNKKVNVVVQFDPETPGTQTHIFDVNLVNKLTSDELGRPVKDTDRFVRSLVLDKLWGDDHSALKEKIGALVRKRHAGAQYKTPPIDANGNGLTQAAIQEKVELAARALEPKMTFDSQQSEVKGFAGLQDVSGNGHKTEILTAEPGPKESLRNFLTFCAENYKTERYMLFILGHGLIVGNDLFLYDENSDRDHTLSLESLAAVLSEFNEHIEGQLELIGFHSCSMSALEVAYELQGTANFMLSSQGPAFVGSWPYREILQRIYDAYPAVSPNDAQITEMLKDICRYTLVNSFDFQLAGYPFDVSLVNLNQANAIKESLIALSGLLVKGLNGPDTERFQQLVLHAHWKAQSFWSEMYTDLYDFCFCLRRTCKSAVPESSKDEEAAERLQDPNELEWRAFLGEVSTACMNVLDVLEQESRRRRARPESGTPLIVQAEFTGPQYQYSHGLSVYFPWSRPINQVFWNDYTNNYKFHETQWHVFLDNYFKATRRDPVWQEIEEEFPDDVVDEPSLVDLILEEVTFQVFETKRARVAGTLGPAEKAGGSSGLGASGLLEKPGGSAGTGGEEYLSIKNYPSFTRKREDAPVAEIQEVKTAGI